MSSPSLGSISGHLIDGDLAHRSYWTRKWRPRFFAIDGANLSWWESEAIATAPGSSGGTTPIGSVQLCDKLSVIVVEEEDDICRGDIVGTSCETSTQHHHHHCDNSEWDDALLPMKDRAQAVASLSVKPQSSSAGATSRSLILLRGKNLKAKTGSAAATTGTASTTTGAESVTALHSSVVSPSTHSRSSMTEGDVSSLSIASGAATPGAGAGAGAATQPLPSSSTGLSYAALRCAGGFLTSNYSSSATSAAVGVDSGVGGGKKLHVLILAHLPRGPSSASSSSSAPLPAPLPSASSSSSSPSAGGPLPLHAAGASATSSTAAAAVTGAGAGLKEPLILATDSRRELQLWMYVLRSRCCVAAGKTPKPLPPHIVAALNARNEDKMNSRRKLGLLERPFVVPITVKVPQPPSQPVSAGPSAEEGWSSTVHTAVTATVTGNGLPADHQDRLSMRNTIYLYLKQRAETSSSSSSDGGPGAAETAAKLKHLEKVLAPRVEQQLYSFACTPITPTITPITPEGAVHFDRESYLDRNTLRQRIRRAFAEHREATTTATGTAAAAAPAQPLPPVKEEPAAGARKGSKRGSKASGGEGSDDEDGDSSTVVSALTSSTTSASKLMAPPPPPPGRRPGVPRSPPPIVASPSRPDAAAAAAALAPSSLSEQDSPGKPVGRPPSGSIAYSVNSISTNAMNGMRMVTRQRYGGPNVPPHPWTSEASPYYLGSGFLLKHFPPPDYDWEPLPVEKTSIGIPVQDATLMGEPALARQQSDMITGSLVAGSLSLPHGPSGAGAASGAAVGTAPPPVPPLSLSFPQQGLASVKERSGSSASSSSSSSSSATSSSGQAAEKDGASSSSATTAAAATAAGPPPASGSSASSYFPLQQTHPPMGASTASMRMTLVLDRRPAHPPPLPILNKWQHRRCASCGVTQSTGLWGVHANFCFFTELLFCSGKPKTQFSDSSSLLSVLTGRDSMFGGSSSSSSAGNSTTCMSEQPRPIPWRVVQDLDATPLPVSKVAGAFIDRVWHLPLVALSAVAPATLAKAPALQRVIQLRARIADLVESAVVSASSGGTAAAGALSPAATATAGGLRSPSPGRSGAAGGAGATGATGTDPLASALSPPSPSLAGLAGPGAAAGGGSGGAAAGGGGRGLYRPSYYTKSVMPSEEPTPIDDAARRSASSAAMKDRLLATGRVHMGSSLGFMLNSVELLPLSLIVPVATSKSAAAKVIGRLTAALNAIQTAVDDAATASLQQAFALAAVSSSSRQPSPSASSVGAPVPPPMALIGNPSPSAAASAGLSIPMPQPAPSRAIAINSNNSNNAAAAAYGRGPQLQANLNGAFGTAAGSSYQQQQQQQQAFLSSSYQQQQALLSSSFGGQAAPIAVAAGSLPKRSSLHSHSLPAGSFNATGLVPVPSVGAPSALGAAMPTPAHPYLRTVSANASAAGSYSHSYGFMGGAAVGAAVGGPSHPMAAAIPGVRPSVPALVGVHQSLLDDDDFDENA